MKSYSDPNKTTIYNYWHDYFTKKHDVAYYPSLKDYLNVENTTDYVMSDGDYAVRHGFEKVREELVYVTKKESEIYSKIYDKVKRDYEQTIKMFNFELIVYDEIEFFRDAGKGYNFSYPFSPQKNNLNYYQPSLDMKTISYDTVYVRRSIVCLQEYFMNQLNLPG